MANHNYKEEAKKLIDFFMKYYDEHRETITINNAEIERLIDFRKTPSEQFGMVLTLTVEHTPIKNPGLMELSKHD